MSRIMIKLFLGASGALLLLTGLTVLLDPLSVLGINVGSAGEDASLLSELRSPGLLLLVSGGLSLAAAFRWRLAGVALQLSILLYGSFGLSRLVAVSIDGMPSTSILAAMVIELVAACLAAVAYVALRKARSNRSGHYSSDDLIACPPN